MSKATATARLLAASIAMSSLAGTTAFAQGASTAPSLTVELNGLEPSSGGCRLTFLVRNGLGAALEKAAFEIVLFDKAGLVQRLTVLDFKDLPDGKTKVRQFDLEAAFGGGCTLPENLQDQARPVDHLALELFLKRTLLNGRKCAVDDDQFGFGQFGIGADLFDLPRPEQGRRAHVAYRLDIAFGHHDADGIGQADGLGQALFGGQIVRLSANVGANHEGARAARHLAFKFIFENLE